jgi:hypothetical protein
MASVVFGKAARGMDSTYVRHTPQIETKEAIAAAPGPGAYTVSSNFKSYIPKYSMGKAPKSKPVSSLLQVQARTRSSHELAAHLTESLGKIFTTSLRLCLVPVSTVWIKVWPSNPRWLRWFQNQTGELNRIF